MAVWRERAAPVRDRIGHKTITVVYDPTANSAQVIDAESGELLPSVVAYWFAWVSFHRETDVYGSPQVRPLPGRVGGGRPPGMPEGSH